MDQLCLSGEVVWGRSAGEAPAQEGRQSLDPGSLTFFHRDGLLRLRRNLPAERMLLAGLSPEAQALYDILNRQGASFISALVSASGLSPEKTHAALWELVRGGLATNDSFTPVRFALSPEGRHVREKDRPSRKTVRRRVGLRMLQGRWSLLPSGSGEEHVESWTRQLLNRYGVLFRELLGLEKGAPPWKGLREVLRRLEYAGQVRRGLFVAGVSGEQYALREAVELIRAMRNQEGSATWTVLSAADPCAVWGVALPGPKIARLPGNLVVLRGGGPILMLEGNRIYVDVEVSADELAWAVALLVQERQGRKLVVEWWNNQRVVASDGWTILGNAGFHTDGERLVYDGLPGPKAITVDRRP